MLLPEAEQAMAPLPIALATSSPERRQRNLARGIAETLDDSIELARRFRERRRAGQPHVGGVRAPVAATLDDSKRVAEHFSERTRHDIATTLEESKQLAERWRARTAPSVARTLAESYELARRFERGQLRPAEPYRPPLPQGRPLLPRTLDDSLAFAARRPTATTSASLADAKAAAARFGARYNVSELVKGPLLRGPDAVVEEPQGPTLRTRGGTGPGAGGTKPLLIDEPVTFKNALWTEYDVEGVDFVDIAAGGGYVWAATDIRDHWRLYVLRPGSSEFEVVENAPPASRVAALSDGTPVVLARLGVFIGENGGADWSGGPLFSSGQPTVYPLDVAAGRAGAFPEILVSLTDGRLLDLFGAHIVGPGGLVSKIAVAGDGTNFVRASDQAKLPRIWGVGAGTLYAGDTVDGLHEVVTPWAASEDVAVDEQGVVFVVDGSGNVWQRDTFGNRWLDTRGKAAAIAAGSDGSLWTVGQEGKIYNRGGRKFGFWEETFRSRPRPKEGWCAYLDEVQVATGNSIVAEAVQSFVDGGASVVRVGQAFNDGTTSEPSNVVGAAGHGSGRIPLYRSHRNGEEGRPCGTRGRAVRRVWT